MIWSDTQDILFLYILDLVATSLSFLGSLWMCIHCLKSPSPKPVSLKFILAIGLSDFLYSISNFMSAGESTSLTPMCYTEAVFRETSFIASVYFATCTAILCYKTTNFDRVFNQERFFKQALILGAVICILLDILPLFVDAVVYQNGPLFCWITFSPDYNNYVKITVRIVYELVPFALGITISLIGYIKAFKKTKELPQEILSFMDVRVTKLFWYPTVMFIVFAPSTIDNFAQIFLPFTAPVALKAMHLALTHSIGFANAIVYGKQRRLYNIKNRKDVYPAEEETDAQYRTRDATSSIRFPLRTSVSQTLLKAASQNYTQMEP